MSADANSINLRRQMPAFSGVYSTLPNLTLEFPLIVGRADNFTQWHVNSTNGLCLCATSPELPNGYAKPVADYLTQSINATYWIGQYLGADIAQLLKPENASYFRMMAQAIALAKKYVDSYGSSGDVTIDAILLMLTSMLALQKTVNLDDSSDNNIIIF